MNHGEHKQSITVETDVVIMGTGPCALFHKPAFLFGQQVDGLYCESDGRFYRPPTPGQKIRVRYATIRPTMHQRPRVDEPCRDELEAA